jgi:hypothetical protein
MLAGDRVALRMPITFMTSKGSCGRGDARLPRRLGNLYILQMLHGEQPHCWDTRTGTGKGHQPLVVGAQWPHRYARWRADFGTGEP